MPKKLVISTIHPSSLIFKIIFITSLILALAISISVWLEIRVHEDHIKKHNLEKSKIISEFIEKNVIRAMEKGKHFEIHPILKNFVYKGVWKIYVVRPDGVIRASTFDGELNKKIDNLDYLVNNKFFIREEAIQSEEGRRRREKIYYYTSPILNHPECFQCHDQKEKVVGVLTVAQSLKEMDEEISRVEREAVILGLITIASSCLILGLFFLKSVNHPIKKLTETMQRVEKGDLEARVDLEGKDEMGRLAESLNTMIDKLRLAKKELEQYHQGLVQRADRMATIGELASGIAHEIRNPLAGIQGAIQILSEGFPKEDGRRQVTDEIEKQIFKLERLVKDLLNYAKPVPANYLPTDMNELVDKVLSFFTTQRGLSEDFKIQRRFSTPLPETMVDPSSMEQAFLNIILNAQKAMPEGGTFTVSTFSLRPIGEGESVQIVFEDTGTGISKENLPKIFNPFFSTRSDGTGLGLSITKNIVEQHGGKIEVESQVDKGTQFIITLPAMKSTAQSA
jgi:signal transduction histidine kinase